MKLYNVFFVLLCFSLVSGCRRSRTISCEEYAYYDHNFLETRIYHAGKNISGQYRYAVGLGRTSEIYPLKSYSYDTALLLPLNFDADTSVFCLVAKDLSIDTVQLVYSRRFYARGYCYACDMENFRLSASSRFKADSSFVRKDEQFSNDYKITLIRQ